MAVFTEAQQRVILQMFGVQAQADAVQRQAAEDEADLAAEQFESRLVDEALLSHPKVAELLSGSTRQELSRLILDILERRPEYIVDQAGAEAFTAEIVKKLPQLALVSEPLLSMSDPIRREDLSEGDQRIFDDEGESGLRDAFRDEPSAWLTDRQRQAFAETGFICSDYLPEAERPQTEPATVRILHGPESDEEVRGQWERAVAEGREQEQEAAQEAAEREAFVNGG